MIQKKYLKIINKIVFVSRKIFKKKLTILDFGNVSFIDKKKKLLFIKGSGFRSENLNPKQVSVLALNKKNILNFINLNKKIKPSVDTLTHLYLYSKMPKVNSIIHTHSKYATILAQLSIEPKCIGTTHADFFYDTIPLSYKIKNLNKEKYEIQLGKSIFKRIKREKYTPPGILLSNHGLYAWGSNLNEALKNTEAIEYICELYYKSILINKRPKIAKNLHVYHYLRKNIDMYGYGQ